MTTRPKTRTNRPSPSPEERRAQAEKMHASIIDQIEELRHSDRWTSYLKFIQSFHQYSLNNILLVLAQRPDASQIAGFRQWQARGRQVRTGEHSIKIFGYSQKTTTTEDENPDGSTDTRKHTTTRYPILSVFDISQTDPIDGHPSPEQLSTALTGADDHGIPDTLAAFLASIGWSLTRGTLHDGSHGQADPSTHTVTLETRLSPEQAAKTAIHETAHIVLGHTDNISEYTAHRGTAETEAESVAYVVAGTLGIDTGSYSIGYIAGWSDCDTTMIRLTADRVLRTSHQIIDILSPAALTEG